MAQQSGSATSQFRGVDLKVKRGSFHLQELQRDFESQVDEGRYIFLPEKLRDGAEYLYRAEHPPPVNPEWSVMIGDCVHNFRSALDHIAWQLVIAHGGTPNRETSFPILSTAPSKPLKIVGGTDQAALRIIEAVQPYNGTSTGKYLKLLSDLDIFDKHREILVTVANVRSASTSADPGNPLLDGLMTFTTHPIEHGTVVARIRYDTPLAEPDPNLILRPYMTFGPGGKWDGEIVIGVLGRLNSEVLALVDKLKRLP